MNYDKKALQKNAKDSITNTKIKNLSVKTDCVMQSLGEEAHRAELCAVRGAACELPDPGGTDTARVSLSSERTRSSSAPKLWTHLRRNYPPPCPQGTSGVLLRSKPLAVCCLPFWLSVVCRLLSGCLLFCSIKGTIWVALKCTC